MLVVLWSGNLHLNAFVVVLKLNCIIPVILFEEEKHNDQNCMNETQASQAPRWRTLLHTPGIPVMSPHMGYPLVYALFIVGF